MTRLWIAAARRSGRAAALLLAASAALTLAACSAPAGARPAAVPPARPSQGSAGPASALGALTARGAGPRYYLALGDSLAVGIQPDQAGTSRPTRAGYPSQLNALLRRHGARLRLVALGCSGETTGTMLHGGRCRYPRGSQLAQAVAFLRAHPGAVPLITIDIGANDPSSCLRAHGVGAMLGCVNTATSAALRQLGAILARLRTAAGPAALIVGMTYYVPELAAWGRGSGGTGLAVLADSLVAGLDRQLTAVYRRHGARVADVFGAFASADFAGRVRLAGRSVPPNVADICALTWMCAPAPRGPNVHATSAGYRVIAHAFWQAITG
ncbi:MAG: SGNH/GDSL hydrolase family protein [Actinomycetota bacterium]|nr:SGNH/GDSL hydrolase family protein [Actinomycetota bacterium]